MSLDQLASLLRRISGRAAQSKRRRAESLLPQVDFLERREVMDASGAFPAPLADPDNPFAVDDSAGLQSFGAAGDAVAVLENGDYVAVWIDSSVSGEYSIYMQRYSGTQAGDPLDPLRTDTGTPEGPLVLLKTTTSEIDSVQITSNSSGQMVVGWREIDGSQLPFRMQRIDADGTLVGGEVVVGLQAANEPTFALSDAGQIVAVWSQVNTLSGVAFDDFYFDELTTTGASFSVQTLPLAASGQEVAIDDNGRFIVVWAATNQTNAGSQVWYRRFDITSGGVVAVELEEVSITNQTSLSTARYATPDVSVNDAGELAIAYTRRITSKSNFTTYDNNEEIVLQVFSGFGDANLTLASGSSALPNAFPSFGNEIMVTGTDVTGSIGRQRFARIDMDNGGNIAIGYQESLYTGAPVSFYVVQYGKDLLNGVPVGYVKAATDVVGTSDDYENGAALDFSLGMNDRGDIVTLFTGGVSATEVDVFARRLGFQLPQDPDTPTEDPPTVIFTPGEVLGYGGSEQDKTPDGLAISEDGKTLTLTGNTWKQVLGTFVITEFTVLEFDFNLISEGEIHAIGFDVDDDFAPDTMFRIAGTQNWGIDATSLVVPGTTTVRIPVGQFYTSTAENPFTRIVLVNDDDANSAAESSFSNIRLFEEIPTTSIDLGGTGMTGIVSTYGGSQDHAINSVTIDNEANSITIQGNSWKKIDLPEDIVIKANTILQFEFDAETLGEIHAIGFANDPENISPSQTFRVAGSQNWGINASNVDQLLVDHDDDPLTPDVFQIPVGQYFTGSFDFLTIVNDDDVSDAVKATFSNIKIFDVTYTPTITIDGLPDEVALMSFGGDQDKAPSVVSIDGDTIRIEGNGWKALALNGGLTITSTTVLSFTFESDSIGEIHGIGFATNATLGTADAKRSFRMAGSQNWGINATTDISPYITIVGNAWTIEVGKFFTGTFDYLTLICDDDADGYAVSQFSNITISNS
ncbi:hypothetical protein LOC68_23565 [Blastopirellula sp. JC732]|uniref:Uncharacterized protein n=1 Tax=Blastopirellula sediminis TaxID=2894196 RepID=A0A9X1MTN0_9BACT|nr:hypothetical protein [Blastopirellula sediminis]MCC9605316.1 hypothetical protein [Blastopirellula sediminis]MCC9631384.1 hypothetical protein [Blastopirellula sediminis]